MSDAPDQFLIEKNGLYYRPESRGYTGIKDEAGRYSFDDAAQIVGPNGPERPQDGLSMWAEADAPDYSPACYWDLKLRHQTRKECEAEAAARIRELEAKLDDLGAIKEKAHRQGYEQGKAAGDAFGAAIREHVERLEAERDALQANLAELLAVAKRAVRLSLAHSDFKLHAMEPMHQAIAAAELKRQDR